MNCVVNIIRESQIKLGLLWVRQVFPWYFPGIAAISTLVIGFYLLLGELLCLIM